MKRLTSRKEATLVRNLSRGNKSAFNSLYRKYSGVLYRFALGYLKSQTEAEEFVHEVFTVIWEERKELKEELSFKSYIFDLSFNIIKKHFLTKTVCRDIRQNNNNSDSREL